jgi:hypothetical protein
VGRDSDVSESTCFQCVGKNILRIEDDSFKGKRDALYVVHVFELNAHFIISRHTKRA